jgi:hypothetical protein
MASATRSAAGATPACPGIKADAYSPDDPSLIMQFINFSARRAPRAGKWTRPSRPPLAGRLLSGSLRSFLLHGALALSVSL